MYVNKCTKCGAEFETKNPKRVICPNCLYPDKKPILSDSEGNATENKPQPQQYQSYSAGSSERQPYRQDRPQRSNFNRQDGGGYNRPQGGYNKPQGGGYNRQQGGYNRPQNGGGYSRQQGGYNRSQGGGGYNRQQGGYNRPQGGGHGRPQGGYNRPQGNRPQRPSRPPQRQKQLLVSKDQLVLIEEMYKKMLPLPNPDAHEIIGESIGLESRKVFFGINLVRQKMFLPKIPFPKRKLAVSPDQLTAIKSLYEPLLPLPPIGCHKIISAQLKMDEWRVHVGIGIIRKQMGLERWNEDRADAPKVEKPVVEEEKKSKKVKAESVEQPAVDAVVEAPVVEDAKPAKKTKTVAVEAEFEVAEDAPEVQEEKPKKTRTTRAKKAEAPVEEDVPAEEEEKPKKRTTRKKKTEAEAE